MKVIRVSAHNVLRIGDIDLSLEGDHLYLIGGQNDQGKTSAIKCLAMGILGRSGMDQWPNKPLRDGEISGHVEIQLSASDDQPNGITIRLDFRRKPDGGIRETLTILDSAGDPMSSPVKLLRKLIKTRSIDPLAFERMTPAEQRDQLLLMVGLDLDEFESRHKKTFDMRALVNRQGKDKAALAKAMPSHKGIERVDTAELTAELRRIGEHNTEVSNRAAKHAAAVKVADDAAEDVSEAKEALKQAKEAVKTAEKCRDQAIEKANDAAGYADPIESDDVLAKVASASDINQQASENDAKAAAETELAELRKESAALSESLKKIDKEKRDAIEGVKFPVEGLGVDSEGVTLNGFAFADACRSKRIVASALIGVSLKPELRLLLSQDGSDLDDDTMDGLRELLEKHDFQMVMEVVTRNDADEDRCQVIIEDGAVKGLVE